MSFPRYPKYKDSGVEWLGEVPEHWEMARFKTAVEVLLSNVDKKSCEDELPVRLCNYTDVYNNERITADLNFMPATASAEQLERFALRAQDTLLTKDSESPDDIAVAAFVPHSLPGIVCGYHLAVARPKAGVHGAFVKRLLDSHGVRAQASVSANGLTRFGLSRDSIANFIVPLPTFDEQTSIADFLDHQTARIDALIQEQQRLIELLKQKRQAVISHAVTEGLDPTVPMKDSGVEWIGSVPAHWEIRKARGLFSERDERSVAGDGEMLTVSHLTGVTRRSEKNVYMFEAQTNEGYKICRKDDLVINTLWGWMGAMGVASEDGLVSPAYNVYRPTDGLNPRYVDSLIRAASFVDEITRFSKGVWSSRLRIYPTEFFQILMPVPPLPEQQGIAETIATMDLRSDALEKKTTEAVTLLQERRSALISAAVTGKIDVRNYTPREAPVSDELYQPA